MTPYEINLLLHFHCVAGPWPRKEAPLYEPVVNAFLASGLIEDSPYPEADYTTTERGKALVERLCAVGFP